MQTILTINNKEYSLELTGHETLLEVLRDRIGLTGTKTACEESECGTCTVQINGRAVLSCITLAQNVVGDKIETIEGLAEGEQLHPVQKAFMDYGAVQCGFCIPGMIMSTKALLENNTTPTQEEIEYALDGNICRCAGYPKILDAVIQAGQMMQSNKLTNPSNEDKKESHFEKNTKMNRGFTYADYVKTGEPA